MKGPFDLPDCIRGLHTEKPAHMDEPPLWSDHAAWVLDMVILQKEEEERRRRRQQRLYEFEDETRRELVGDETLLECERLPVYEYEKRPGGDFKINWSRAELDARTTPPPPIYGPSEDTRDLSLRDCGFGDCVFVDKFVIYRHCMNLSASVATGWRGQYMPYLRGWRPFNLSKPGERYYSIYETSGPVVEFHIPYTGEPKPKKRGRGDPRAPKESMNGAMSVWGFVDRRRLKTKLPKVRWIARAKIIKPSPKQLQAQFRRFQVATCISAYPGRSEKELLELLKREFIECREIGTKKSGGKLIVSDPDQQAVIPWDQQKVNPILRDLIKAGKVYNRYAINGAKIYYTIDRIFT